MQTPSLFEKRRAARVPVAMKVAEAEGERTIGFGYARDISERGLAVEGEALVEDTIPPSPGTEIRMRFKLPKSDLVITARARVVRIDKGLAPRIAMEFLGLSADFRAEIARYVSATAQ